MNLNDIILNEKQRQIYLLRQQGQLFSEIGEKLGISASTASKHYKEAVRVIRMAQWYQKKVSESREEIQLTVTKGELQAIVDSLLLMERCQQSRGKRQTANEYQQEYLQMQQQSLESVKKKLMIMLLGEEKYNRMSEI